MVEIKCYSGGSVSTRSIDERVFGERVLGRTLKEALVMYEANRRAGTAKTKERGEVKGPNKKLWKQKHTGRARMGTPKSPLWTGGGVIFGPRPRDYGTRMPLKVRRLALRCALLAKLRDGEVSLLDLPALERPSTKTVFGLLEAAGVERDTLLVTDAHDPRLLRSVRNIPTVSLRVQSDLNAWDVLRRRNLVLTPPALQALQDRMAAHEKAAHETAAPETAAHETGQPAAGGEEE